ncbi:hypothetical protein PGT21_021600 [Puccinia graminis f. sp. tritici]|uniref:Uncharacterized protein n=1 Tax=Puccinia graminis f. sp. tritici TaxID=56615 RepID=A0A5B0PY62_PUCGR|nr:hypothetical protein PGT21_021600 [Puccinia graminis f. sp. tritici]
MIRLAPGSGAGSALSRPAGPDRIRHILVGSFHKRSVVSSVQYGVRFGRSRLGAAEVWMRQVTKSGWRRLALTLFSRHFIFSSSSNSSQVSPRRSLACFITIIEICHHHHLSLHRRLVNARDASTRSAVTTSGSQYSIFKRGCKT